MSAIDAMPIAHEPLVSILIPALDEADSLGEIIAAVRAGDVPCEILVVDAGSADDTVKIATAAGARLIHSVRPQRAFQLNLGAQQARAGVLLFLHADTILPPRALQFIVGALEDRTVVGGAFARRYASRSLLLRATCLLAQCRNHLFGWHLGDQAMFVRRSNFFELGGFREVDQFEDLDFSRRLRTVGRTITLPTHVTSSSRRFDRHGALGTTLHDVFLTLRYLLRGLPEPRAAGIAPKSDEGFERRPQLRRL
ncbi:MAG: TIGR04283 family arsenosugar biosynthesis glycosyltransferase [Chthoniobacterales bacterium]